MARRLRKLGAKDDITLSQATSPHLQRLLARSGPKVTNLLPQRSSVRRWIMDAYVQRKPEVAESLHTSLSDVSLSFDGWSSPNGLSLLGVVAHWIDKDCTLRNALIGMPRLEGQHSGEKIAMAVSALIRDYGIQRKIGAFVLDNATNNDTAVEILAQEFGLDPAQCRLRCWGHTVNLVVKALLFGEGLTAFQKELSDAGDDESFDIWRRQHAIGKLHNIVRYIMRSDQRVQMFNEAQRDIADDITTFCYRLVKDTGIRWNSVYNMIARALLLENPIRSYCRQWRRQDNKAYDLSQDFLSEGDWEELRHYEELLLPFKLATERLEGKGNKLSLEGSHGALWEVLPAFDFLFMMLKIRADDVSKNPDLFVDHYRHCINHGFEKLKEYYGKSDRTRLYRAAIALHPCYRNDYFANAWAKVPRSRLEIKNAQNAVAACYTEFLSTLRKSENCSTGSHSEPITDTSIKETDDIYAQFDNFFNTVRRNATISAERCKKKRKREDSELDRFLELSLEDLNVTDLYKNQPIAWWRDFGQRMFPTLAKLAFKLLAIPGMSAECERAFSQAKRMITDERFNLKQDVIEAEQCLKSWLINKVADGQKAWDTLQQVQMENVRESASASKGSPGRVDTDMVSASGLDECLVFIP